MFTEPDIWSGGHFELALELGPRNDPCLRDAVSALWKHTTLVGCYLASDKEPTRQIRIEPTSQPLESNLCGVATTPAGCEVACRSISMRLDDGTDWLYFVIPLGSLGTAYPVGAYPYEDGTSVNWILPVSEWFREIGESVFGSVDFRLGLVGHEVDADEDSVRIERDGVPDQRWIGYLWPRNRTLCWYPPNIMEAPMLFGEALKKKPWWRFW